MKLNIILLAFFLVVALPAGAQSGPPDFGPEFQAYPTGLIPGIRIEKNYGRYVALLRLGYNWVRHGGAGLHDDERGGGPGFSLGCKRYFGPKTTGWSAAVKSDLWFNKIDWKDLPGQPGERAGQTRIIVFQPVVEAGYTVSVSRSLYFSPTVSFGYEINIKTSGEPTGEGPILLVGVVLMVGDN